MSSSTVERTGGSGFRVPNLGFDRFSGFYLGALFIILFGLWKPDQFLKLNTAHSVASEQAIVAMLGLAVLVPLAAGVFDLSIGATINLSAVSVALLQVKHGWGMVPSIIVAILIGVAIGLINGFLVVGLHVSSFIATLGSATIIGAFQTIVTDQSQPLPPTTSAWLNLTQHKIFGFQIVVYYLIILALIFWWALDHTPAGPTSKPSAATPKRRGCPASRSASGCGCRSSRRGRSPRSPGCSTRRCPGRRSPSAGRCCSRRTPLRSSGRPSSSRDASTCGAR